MGTCLVSGVTFFSRAILYDCGKTLESRQIPDLWPSFPSREVFKRLQPTICWNPILSHRGRPLVSC